MSDLRRRWQQRSTVPCCSGRAGRKGKHERDCGAVDERAHARAAGVRHLLAAELAGVEPRSLRHYEQRGLIHPARTSGGTRRYSNDDVARGRRITALRDGGLNLAGTAMVLDLEAQLAMLRAILERIHRDHSEINIDPEPSLESSIELPGRCPLIRPHRPGGRGVRPRNALFG